MSDRPTPPWVCQWCGHASPYDRLNLEWHEPKCPSNPDNQEKP